MKSEAWIPIVVGVTGHRSIRQADRPALYAAVREELSKLRARCSHSLFVMLSSLAEGAGRDFEFRPAGIFVAAHSHVLLALWDGGSSTEADCGTAAAADFALNGSYYPISGSFTRRCPPGSKNTARRRSS